MVRVVAFQSFIPADEVVLNHSILVDTRFYSEDDKRDILNIVAKKVLSDDTGYIK